MLKTKKAFYENFGNRTKFGIHVVTVRWEHNTFRWLWTNQLSNIKFIPKFQLWISAFWGNTRIMLVISMMEMCWWQVWDVGDRFRMLVTDLINRGHHQHNEKRRYQYPKSVINKGGDTSEFHIWFRVKTH